MGVKIHPYLLAYLVHKEQQSHPMYYKPFNCQLIFIIRSKDDLRYAFALNTPTSIQSEETCASWHPPLHNVLKLNTNGSSLGNPVKQELGGLFMIISKDGSMVFLVTSVMLPIY